MLFSVPDQPFNQPSPRSAYKCEEDLEFRFSDTRGWGAEGRLLTGVARNNSCVNCPDSDTELPSEATFQNIFA